MTPRFLSAAREDGGAVSRKGFLSRKGFHWRRVWLESGRRRGGSKKWLRLRIWGSEKSGCGSSLGLGMDEAQGQSRGRRVER